MPDEGHDSNLLPEEWRYLPFLSLPDGAHNYQEGTSHSYYLQSLMNPELHVSTVHLTIVPMKETSQSCCAVFLASDEPL